MTAHLHLYRQQQVQHEVDQASPVKLILLLYDREVFLLRQALVKLKEGDVAKKGEAILKATDILSEFKAILNLEEGGDLAAQLDNLYTFMVQQLTVANHENNPEPITAVLKIVEELREGWRELEQLTLAETTAGIPSA
ncbi:MAG: flagellar export chaperone FliS [Nitrospirae bacterium]|nr:flagellar export chaperone FliS [Nitrospirota bacterium]